MLVNFTNFSKIMKSVFIVLTLGLLLQFFAGCQNSDIRSFNKPLDLMGKVISSEILNPNGLIACDSLLFVREQLIGEKLFKIINLHDGEIISEVVHLGKGPGELINPASLILDEYNTELWIADWGKNEIFCFPIDSIIQNNAFLPTRSIKILKGYIPMMNMFYYNKSFGFSSYNLRRDLISFIDNKGNLIDSLAIRNKFFKNLWEDKGLSDNPLLIHYNKNKRKFVVAGRYTNQFAILDQNGKTMFELEYPFVNQSNYSDDRKWTGNYHTFYNIHSDEEFIYCIYAGDYIIGFDERNNSPVFNYPNKMFVFDWSGEMCYNIKLDQRIVFSTFDVKRKRIIASTFEDEPKIVIYNLSIL